MELNFSAVFAAINSALEYWIFERIVLPILEPVTSPSCTQRFTLASPNVL